MSSDKNFKNKALDQIDAKLNKELSKLLKKEKKTGAVGADKLMYTKGKLDVDYVLVIGLGGKKEFTLESIRVAGSSILRTAKQVHATKVVADVLGAGLADASDADCVQALCEGFILSGYKFTKYLKPDEVKAPTLVLSSKKQTAVKKAIAWAQTTCEGACLARDLVNMPANVMTPLELARYARKLPGVKTRVYNLKEIKNMKMGAFLSVALGSTANPPCFIEMHYKPRTQAKKKIALIGKGVTFDTGGYSIKPAKGMENMKDDMAGAAAVVSFMSIIAKLKPNVEVHAYVAATENMVDGYAQRPGDVCKSLSGKTIEVLNTDAEGRLTLADALTYAIKKKPDYVIDMATLTGACLVALGFSYTGILGNDQKLVDKLIACGLETGEKMWQLPLIDEYRSQLKSSVADLKNIGTGYAGTTTAALFLENFVGKTKWAHMDIAGSSWTDSGGAYTSQGGTGVMVRTLAKFVSEL